MILPRFAVSLAARAGRTLVLALIVLGSSAAALGACEGMLRHLRLLPPAAIAYLHPVLRERHPWMMEVLREAFPWGERQPHRTIGWLFSPGLTAAGRNEDGDTYSVTFSADGLFTPDPPSSDPRQLVVLGDSFMSTYYVPAPTPFRLRALLGVPVLNIAAGGWGPNSYRAAYREFVKPSSGSEGVVLVVTFMNDITDVLNWQLWQATNPSMWFYDFMRNQARGFGELSFNRGDSWWDRNSVLWNLAKLATQKAGERAPPVSPAGPKPEAFVAAPAGRPFDLLLGRGYPYQLFDPPDFAPGGQYWRYLEEYFAELRYLRDDIRASGRRMVLAWIPAKERVYIPLLAADRRTAYVENRSGRIDGLELAIAAFAEREELPFVDLTPALETRAARGEKLYFTRDGHFNAYGNGVVAELLAEFVRPRIAPAATR